MTRNRTEVNMRFDKYLSILECFLRQLQQIILMEIPIIYLFFPHLPIFFPNLPNPQPHLIPNLIGQFPKI